jgi:hypothetical protein
MYWAEQLKNSTVIIQAGINKLPIAMDNMAKGTYYLSVKPQNDKAQTIKVIKN